MSARLAPAQIAMIALCLLMTALFVYQLEAAPAAFALPVVHLQPKALAVTEPPAFLPPPQSAFDAVNDRPLFLPSRKAIAVPAGKTVGAAPTGPPPLPALALVGVILDGQNSLAMVKQAGAPLVQAMAVGAVLGDWHIASIAPDAITLQAGTFTQNVRMDAKAGTAPTPPPPAPGTPQ
jgi:hypothetical protein